MAFEKLPEALVTEILSRLPVKPLLRSKSVCKAWYSLIQNPSFISLHHNHAASIAVTKNTDCLLVKRSRNGGCHGIVLSFVPNETPIENIDVSFIGLDKPDLLLLGPCNGVVCLTTSGWKKSTIALCNPSMKEFRVLPQPSYKKGYVANLGFGFDPSTNDYKVVKFGYRNPYHNPHTNTDDIDETIEIYELSTDSWREGHLNSQIQFDSDFRCYSFASWKGDFYWYMFCRNGADAIIVFRMTDEVFDAKLVPEVCLLDNSIEKELCVLNDSLALVLWTEPLSFSVRNCPSEKCLDIWVMDEQGAEVSWTKKFSIGPLQWLEYPLGFRQNGEFLWVSDRGRLMSYNLDTRQIKEYQVCGDSRLRCVQVLLYTESLVSVKRHNERDGHDDLHV